MQAERSFTGWRLGWCAIALLAGGCIRAALAASAPVTPAEYEVLSAVVGHGLDAQTRSIAIASQTTGDPAAIVPPEADLAALAEKLETTPGLLATWAALNRERSTLEPKLTTTVHYELVDEALRAKLFAEDDPVTGWARFAKRFPHAPGLLRMSRVALDDARMNALVYVEFACGPACGTGRLIRLARAGGTWQVLSGELMWVAGE